MRVVGYIRVSSDRQVEYGNGLDIQERAIRAWCKANQHKLIGIHSDEGVSGGNGIEHRVGLPAALADIRDRQAEALVIVRLDRLARSLHVQEAALAAVWQLDGLVFTTESGEVMRDDPEDPFRTTIRQIIGAFAELERRLIVKRLTNGRRRKAEEGGFAAFGSPEYGKRAEGKTLVPDEDEQRALARIRELHDAHKSLREIAAMLTAEGYRPKRSDHWHPQTLSRIVKRL